MPDEEIRWHYRFRNFSRAFRRLQDALQEGAEALNELELEGVIQRFEYTFELAWNTLKDRLEHDGMVLSSVTPRAVIRSAFQAKLISEGERWIDMLVDRNRMSHTYDSDTFEAIIKEIEERYLDRLNERLNELHKRTGGGGAVRPSNSRPRWLFRTGNGRVMRDRTVGTSVVSWTAVSAACPLREISPRSGV